MTVPIPSTSPRWEQLTPGRCKLTGIEKIMLALHFEVEWEQLMSVEWKRRKQLELELGSELTMVDSEVILTPEQCGRVESERHNRLEGCIIAYFKRFYLEEDPSGDFDFDGIERFKRECQQLNASAGYGMAHYNGLPP